VDQIPHAVPLIGGHLHASRVHYAQIQGSEFVIGRSYAGDAAAPFPDRGRVACFGKAVAHASQRNETVVVGDARTDSRFTEAERAQFLSSGIAAFLSVPLTKGGRWLATLGLHSRPRRILLRLRLTQTESSRAGFAGRIAS